MRKYGGRRQRYGLSNYYLKCQYHVLAEAGWSPLKHGVWDMSRLGHGYDAAAPLFALTLRSHWMPTQSNCGRRDILRDTKALGTCYYIMLESGGTEVAASFNAGVLAIKQANGVSSNENMCVSCCKGGVLGLRPGVEDVLCLCSCVLCCSMHQHG